MAVVDSRSRLQETNACTVAIPRLPSSTRAADNQSCTEFLLSYMQLGPYTRMMQQPLARHGGRFSPCPCHDNCYWDHLCSQSSACQEKGRPHSWHGETALLARRHGRTRLGPAKEHINFSDARSSVVRKESWHTLAEESNGELKSPSSRRQRGRALLQLARAAQEVIQMVPHRRQLGLLKGQRAVPRCPWCLGMLMAEPHRGRSASGRLAGHHRMPPLQAAVNSEDRE